MWQTLLEMIMAKTKQVPKKTPQDFPLQRQAGRVALLSGILCETVGREEIQHAMIVDTGKREYRKPVVVEGIRFQSVVEAARWLVARRPGYVYMTNHEYVSALNAAKKYITYWCNKDDTEGYYWA